MALNVAQLLCPFTIMLDIFTEERHYQEALQQHQAQCPRQCIPGGLPGNVGRALAGDGLQDRQLTCRRAVVKDGGDH
jgi:hypothetical protein